MQRPPQRWLPACLALLLALLGAGSAQAHGKHSSPIQTFTQMVGPYEIGVTVELPPATPAPITLDVEVPKDIGAATIVLRAAPRGQPFSDANRAEVATAATGEQPIYNATLNLDRPGDWELEIVAKGAKGEGMARVPFTITPAPLQPFSIPLYVSIGALILFMIANIIASSAAQRRGAAGPSWLGRALGYGAFGTLVAVAIFGAQQYTYTTEEAKATAAGFTYLPAGTLITDSGRPHANLALQAAPAPALGQSTTLTITLTDGGTGLPIDDIVTHHNALLHLAVISDDGSYYLHTHPARVAPGVYQVAITPTQAGGYTAYAEIERVDSGSQVLRGSFSVAGAAVAATPAPGLGQRSVGGVQVDVQADAAPRAGQQSTLTFSFRDAAGQPIRDLSPWLGMAGHLMARSADGVIFAHVHAAERMPPYGRPMLVNGVTYGPDIRFVYTFPQAGRYQVWGQFKYKGDIITVPISIEVAP
ncbi:hypothetical protein F8S13_19140 [Chloroflexia bacterium SDU3-3]|nr:hypothetical protein F8S13_19140 [Chloroflexia bacterium SDU3-3]